MISAWKAIELADRSDDPSPFELVHRAVAKMRESAAKPIEYAEERDILAEDEMAFYLAQAEELIQQVVVDPANLDSTRHAAGF